MILDIQYHQCMTIAKNIKLLTQKKLMKKPHQLLLEITS